MKRDLKYDLIVTLDVCLNITCIPILLSLFQNSFASPAALKANHKVCTNI